MKPWVQSLKGMGEVCVVLIFILIIYAGTGIGEFKGNVYCRCRTTPHPVNGIWKIDESVDRLCDAHDHGIYTCPSNLYCGSPQDHDIDVTHDEKYGSELVFYGAVGFENIFKAFLATFQAITFDDWAKIMYRMRDADDSVLSVIFFPTLVFFGSFFCLNLIVAVVVDTFQSTRAEYSSEDDSFVNELSIDDGKRKGKVAAYFKRKAKTSSKKKGKRLSPEIEIETEDDKVSGFTIFSKTIKYTMTYKIVITITIIFNLILLLINRSGASETEIFIIDILDIIIFIVFICEMILGIGVHGILKYIRIKSIDLITNILGLIEVILTWSIDSKSNLE